MRRLKVLESAEALRRVGAAVVCVDELAWIYAQIVELGHASAEDELDTVIEDHAGVPVVRFEEDGSGELEVFTLLAHRAHVEGPIARY